MPVVIHSKQLAPRLPVIAAHPVDPVPQSSQSKPPLARQTVCVDDIRIEAFIGVHGHEKNRRQSLIVAVELEIDPPRTDRITETVDYNRITEACRELADQGIALIESFATSLGETLMADARIIRASIHVTKPGALPNGIARTTAELVRTA
ncbi:MAG: dihydroneopterin aldolase [Novosphingobium sp.]